MLAVSLLIWERDAVQAPAMPPPPKSVVRHEEFGESKAEVAAEAAG